MEGKDVLDYDESNISAAPYRYAGFWIRVLAYIIDCLILAAPTFFLQYIILGSTIGSEGSLNDQLISIAIWWAYYAVLESSSLQGTLGKKIVGIKVIDESGNRISVLRATGRFWGMSLACLILFIGIIMIAFNKRKQGLHDQMARCLVVHSRS